MLHETASGSVAGGIHTISFPRVRGSAISAMYVKAVGTVPPTPMPATPLQNAIPATLCITLRHTNSLECRHAVQQGCTFHRYLGTVFWHQFAPVPAEGPETVTYQIAGYLSPYPILPRDTCACAVMDLCTIPQIEQLTLSSFTPSTPL